MNFEEAKTCKKKILTERKNLVKDPEPDPDPELDPDPDPWIFKLQDK